MSPSFVTHYPLVSEIAKCEAVMLFYYNVYCDVFIEKYVHTKFRLDWLLCHGPYRNVLPEAVYCCLTRTTLFTKLFTCLYDQS